MSEDWRLLNLEASQYLRGIKFTRKAYRAPSKSWDHDHCEICFAKFMEPPATDQDILHEGYASTQEYVRGEDYAWLCPTCFDDFSTQMGWTDVG
jgi:hypothetical protein